MIKGVDRVYIQADIQDLAQAILQGLEPQDTGTILALQGDLGSGKTTLAKAIAGLLGVAGELTSPTFVVAKAYDATEGKYKKLVHIDAYRIEDESELGPIGFAEYIADPGTLTIVEWPEMISTKIEAHPHTHWYSISHIDEQSRRIIKR